jgi:hypothetical protein
MVTITVSFDKRSDINCISMPSFVCQYVINLVVCFVCFSIEMSESVFLNVAT